MEPLHGVGFIVGAPNREGVRGFLASLRGGPQAFTNRVVDFMRIQGHIELHGQMGDILRAGSWESHERDEDSRYLHAGSDVACEGDFDLAFTRFKG